MLLCFDVKNSYLIQEHHCHDTTHSLRVSANNNSLKHPSPQSRHSSKWQIGHIITVQRMSSWLHWRSIPSQRLWQSTKTGRRWADVVFTDTVARPCHRGQQSTAESERWWRRPVANVTDVRRWSARDEIVCHQWHFYRCVSFIHYLLYLNVYATSRQG